MAFRRSGVRFPSAPPGIEGATLFQGSCAFLFLLPPPPRTGARSAQAGCGYSYPLNGLKNAAPAAPEPVRARPAWEFHTHANLHSRQADRPRDSCPGCRGTPADNAGLVAGLLVEANSAGHDSHGVIRLPQYLAAVERKEIVPDAEVEVVRKTPMMAVVEGNWGFGQVTMSRATELGLDRARQTGMAVVAVRQANHIGRLGSYVDLIAREGMIGMMFVNAAGVPQLRMAPWGGTEPRLLTDPLAFGIPNPSAPIVIDMTTTVVAEGKVRVARQPRCEDPGWMAAQLQGGADERSQRPVRRPARQHPPAWRRRRGSQGVRPQRRPRADRGHSHRFGVRRQGPQDQKRGAAHRHRRRAVPAARRVFRRNRKISSPTSSRPLQRRASTRS